MLFLAYLYFRRKTFVPVGSDSLTSGQQWRRLSLVMSAWSSTFLLNMALNLLLPAVSPRIFIADAYKTEVKGIFLADILRSAVGKGAANSFSAFPSGHCGLSWLTVAIANAMGFQRYGRITYVAGAIITVATITLRYHYIIDAIAALILLRWGKFIGFLDSPEVFRAAVLQQVVAGPASAVAGAGAGVGATSASGIALGAMGPTTSPLAGGAGSVSREQQGLMNGDWSESDTGSGTVLVDAGGAAGKEFGGSLRGGIAQPFASTLDV